MTGVTITMLVLVHAEITPLATVPSAGAVIVGEVKVGVASVGLVPNTNAPVPVSSVTALRKLAELGVVKNVDTPAPNPLMPVATGKSVQLLRLPDVGVPKIGVTRVGLVLNTNKPVPVSSVIAARKFALVGVAKNTCTLVP